MPRSASNLLPVRYCVASPLIDINLSCAPRFPVEIGSVIRGFALASMHRAFDLVLVYVYAPVFIADAVPMHTCTGSSIKGDDMWAWQPLVRTVIADGRQLDIIF
ncbi:hypothetical protein SETIT_1G371500v2 [Setaria italica]|uniref:Uncharacterized protein n=1 Tax=Setaria italica TaxID=4555 RepID=A0A368PTB7_SETIT|nr:hypothetical protein SETIT_1G371500v2 [Setaria italica]